MIRITITLLLSLLMGWWITGVPQAGLLVGCFIAASVEYIVYRRDKIKKMEADAVRREVMAFLGQFPDSEPEELEELLPAALYGRYKTSSCSDVQELADQYRERLKDAGNASLAEDLPMECQLPILVLYPMDGEFREETLEEYADRCADAIRKASITYHTALKQQNGGKNYQSDVLIRRN